VDAYEALYTTRAMRRTKKDPIPELVQQRILDAAVRAPSGGNGQGWRFLLVDDPKVKGQLGPIYRGCMEKLWGSIYKDRVDAAKASPDKPESIEFDKMFRSASYFGTRCWLRAWKEWGARSPVSSISITSRSKRSSACRRKAIGTSTPA